MITSPEQAYRQYAADGASPLGLIGMLYEAAVVSLHRALHAVEVNEIQQKTVHLNHVLAVIGELQSTLDFERGGEVARILERFYAFARNRVVEASIQNSQDILRQLAAQFLSLRDAWQQVESGVPANPGTAEVPSAIRQTPASRTGPATQPAR